MDCFITNKLYNLGVRLQLQSKNADLKSFILHHVSKFTSLSGPERSCNIQGNCENVQTQECLTGRDTTSPSQLQEEAEVGIAHRKS